MGWWRAVTNSTDNKAISAPSWGLAGWLGLNLATNNSTNNLNFRADMVPDVIRVNNTKNLMQESF